MSCTHRRFSHLVIDRGLSIDEVHYLGQDTGEAKIALIHSVLLQDSKFQLCVELLSSPLLQYSRSRHLDSYFEARRCLQRTPALVTRSAALSLSLPRITFPSNDEDDMDDGISSQLRNVFQTRGLPSIPQCGRYRNIDLSRMSARDALLVDYTSTNSNVSFASSR